MDVAEVKEAIELLDAAKGGVVGVYEARQTVLDAARRWVRMVSDPPEPDWEAAYAERDHQIGPELDDVAVQQIVKAATECSLCGRLRFLCGCVAAVGVEKETENG